MIPVKTMKASVYATILTVLALAVGPAIVFANVTGTIRIDPYLPMGVGSPAEFTVWVKPSANPTSDPHIFLVMTKSSFDGLTDEVTVEWTGDSVADLVISNAEWTMETSPGKKIPPDTTPGAGYTVASLKDHLETSDGIYWAFKPFLSGDLTTSPKTFTVTLPSDDARMLVYVLGKTDGNTVFNNRVPPTIPGFVVPEPAAIAAAATSFGALAAYALIKRKR